MKSPQTTGEWAWLIFALIVYTLLLLVGAYLTQQWWPSYQIRLPFLGPTPEYWKIAGVYLIAGYLVMYLEIKYPKKKGF